MFMYTYVCIVCMNQLCGGNTSFPACMWAQFVQPVVHSVPLKRDHNVFVEEPFKVE